MPLYEYECESCGHREELIQRVGAPPVGPCPRCGGAMKRLISAPAFQFKGTGWYVTDYAKKSGSTAESAGSDTASTKKDSDSSKEPKKEAPAAKPDTKGD